MLKMVWRQRTTKVGGDDSTDDHDGSADVHSSALELCSLQMTIPVYAGGDLFTVFSNESIDGVIDDDPSPRVCCEYCRLHSH